MTEFLPLLYAALALAVYVLAAWAWHWRSLCLEGQGEVARLRALVPEERPSLYDQLLDFGREVRQPAPEVALFAEADRLRVEDAFRREFGRHADRVDSLGWALSTRLQFSPHVASGTAYVVNPGALKPFQTT